MTTVTINETFRESYLDTRSGGLFEGLDSPEFNVTPTEESFLDRFLLTYTNRNSLGTWTLDLYGSIDIFDFTVTLSDVELQLGGNRIATIEELNTTLELFSLNVDNPSFLGGNDYIFAGQQRDYLDGKTGTDYLYGKDGSDIFYDTDLASTDYFFGGSGYDHFEFRPQSKSDWVVGTSTRSDLPSDTHFLYNSNLNAYEYINSIETVHFSDGKLRFDIDTGDEPGQAYRLYQAAFARTPDMPGVRYHVNDMESNGLSLSNVANNFIASPEFKNMYGENPTDEEYINALYRNVLNRSASNDEVSWYQDQFNTGAMDRAAALIGFAESPENVALVAPDLVNGVWLPDPF